MSRKCASRGPHTKTAGFCNDKGKDRFVSSSEKEIKLPKSSKRWAYVCKHALKRHRRTFDYRQQLASKKFQDYIKKFENDIIQLFSLDDFQSMSMIKKTSKMANKLQHSQNLVVPYRSEEILRHYNVQKEKRSRSPSLVLHQPDHYGCRSNVPGSSISHLDHNLSCNQTFDPTATSTYDKYHVALDKQLELEKSCVTKCLSDCCKKEHILREKSKLIPCKPVKYVDLGWNVHAFQRTNKCKEPAPNQHEFNVNKTVASNLSELQIYGQLTDCECQDMDLSSEPTEESLTLIAKRENDCEKNEKEYLNSYEPSSGFQNDPKQAMFFKNSSTMECQADKENQSLFKNGQNWYHQPPFPSVLPMNNTGTFNQQSNSVFPTLRLFNSARPSPMNIMTQQAAPRNIITQQAAPTLPNNFGLRDDFMIHSIYPLANRFPVFNGSLLNQNLWRGMINPHQRPAFLVGGFNQPNTSQLVLENFIKQFLGFGRFFPPY